MSYDIYIGNAEVEELEEDDVSYQIRVNRITLPDAPTFPGDEMTGNGNSRHPGYSQWSEFCRKSGLYNLFFDKEDGLMQSHPGNTALNESHSKVIEQALADWKEDHPNATPGFDNDLHDPILARLIWLDFWVKWALKNCEHPAIWNY
jgi:hypothetical protein